MKRLALGLCVVIAACAAPDDGNLVVFVTVEDEALLRDGVAYLGDARVQLRVVDKPEAQLASRAGASIAVVTDARCDDCFRVDGSGKALTAKGGGVLGRQYAAWQALEAFGYRFTHPWHTHKPTTFSAAATAALGKDFAPSIKKRRGLHLHTLHPTESLADFWVPAEKNLEGAKRTVDFVVKNRGNYLQWCALDDILKAPDTQPAWLAHTRAITDFAHAHGVNTGIALQLFGQSNLQNAYDLIDDDTGDVVPEMERRLHVLLDGAGFDALNLSFGEFFGADPARFVAEVDQTYAAMQRVQPGVEVMGTIHVGNYDNLRVTFMNERLLYYFLIKFANPAIVPWVHTTMFYNLYDDAGLAYLHEEFDEHRAYLEGRLAAQQPVGYFPESAYWVAFDINVPIYTPVYVKSRHTDLVRLTGLDDHVLFSSGWEYGYWLTDAATLRMTYGRTDAWDEVVKDVFAGWGEVGAQTAGVVSKLAEAQHRALIVERLAAYAAGRDQIIDTGDRLGIFSQPDRPEFTEVLAMTPAQREDFRVRVVEKLKVHADELTALVTEADALQANEDPVLVEVQTGVRVTAARLRFIHALYSAALAHAAGASTDALLAQADADFDVAKAIVGAQRKMYWDPEPLSLVAERQVNATFYQYGYLREADTLCFWRRERAQLRNAVLSRTELVPGCVL